MRKRILFCVILNIFLTISFGQDLVWVNEMGGESHDYSSKIITDYLGNVYTCGRFKETVDFDSGPETYDITVATPGASNAYLQKLNSDGDHIWTLTFPSTGNNYIGSIGIDSENNLLIVGGFYDSLTLGDTVFVADESQDVFIAKLDLDGEFIWQKSVGGPVVDGGTFDGATGINITTDEENNVYALGNFQGAVDFDPGEEEFWVASDPGAALSGSTETYILKLDSDGEFIWVRNYWATSSEFQIEDGYLYVGGRFTLEKNFGSEAEPIILATGGWDWHWDIYILKMTLDNEIQWVKQVGGLDGDYVRSMCVTGDNIYLGGWYDGTIDFDPGDGTYIAESTISDDMYFLNLDTSGNFKTVLIYEGGSYTEEILDIGHDEKGNIYACGLYKGVIDFDAGPDEHIATNLTGQSCYFVFQLDSLLNFNWLISTEDQLSMANSMSFTDAGNFYVAGYYSTFGDFDPGPDTLELPVHGWGDIFIAKFETCSPTWGSIDTVVIDIAEYMVPSGDETYFESGDYMDTLINQYGCDSLIAINLDFCFSTWSSIDTVVLDEYTVPSGDETYYESGDYMDTLINVSGCDSIISINLDISGYSNIAKNILEPGLGAYPNPFSDHVMIRITESTKSDNLFVIHDILGNEVYRIENITTSSFQIKKSELGAGVFLVSLITENSPILTIKLVAN